MILLASPMDFVVARVDDLIASNMSNLRAQDVQAYSELARLSREPMPTGGAIGLGDIVS